MRLLAFGDEDTRSILRNRTDDDSPKVFANFLACRRTNVSGLVSRKSASLRLPSVFPTAVARHDAAGGDEEEALLVVVASVGFDG